MARGTLRTARAGAVALAGAVLVGGCGGVSSASGESGHHGGRPEIGREQVVEALARGWYPGRVGDIAVIPDPQAIITYRSESNRFMHGGPWPFDSDLLLLLHGASFFRPGVYGGPASHQDIGATVTDLLGLPPSTGQTGRPLREAFANDEATGRPGLVALIVLDAMRADYLERTAELLPNLMRLAAESARFPEARVDYLPTNTSTAHSTISTATDPALHGIVGNGLYDRRTGESRSAYEGAAPYNLMALTFADRWSVATRGRAEIVAQAGTDYPAVALAGHGACILGGSPRWLAYYDSESGTWATNEDCYHLPPAAAELRFGPRLDAVDRLWLGHEIDSFSEARRSSLFTAFEGETAVALIEGSAFGEDEITDLFLVNLKSPDYVSHKYGPFSPEMDATLAETGRVDRPDRGGARGEGGARRDGSDRDGGPRHARHPGKRRPVGHVRRREGVAGRAGGPRRAGRGRLLRGLREPDVPGPRAAGGAGADARRRRADVGGIAGRGLRDHRGGGAAGPVTPVSSDVSPGRKSLR